MTRFRFDVALNARLPDDAVCGFGLGDDIDVTDPAIYAEVCIRGWQPLEPAGAWNLGETAILEIRLADVCAEPPLVWIEGDAFVTDTHSQFVSVACEGIRLRPVCLSPPVATVLRIAWPPGGMPVRRLALALEFANLMSPTALGVAADQRPLGFMVRRIVVTDPDASRPSWLTGDTVTLDDTGGGYKRPARALPL